MLKRLILKITRNQPRVRLFLGLSFLSLVLLSATSTASMLMVLSPAQSVASKLGSYQQRADLPSTLHLGEDLSDAVAPSPDPTRFAVQLMSPDFYFDSAPAQSLMYFEGSWDHEGSAFGLNLDSGRWPSAAGEVLTTTTTGEVNHGNASAFSGNLKVHVVGTVTNAYAENSKAVYAAPGTWDQTTQPAFASTIAARPMLFDSETEDPGQLQQAIEAMGMRRESDFSSATSIEATRISATDLLRHPPRSIIEDYSFLFGAFAVLLPFFFTFFLTAVQRRGVQRAEDSLYQLGIPRSVMLRLFFRRAFITVGALSVLALLVGVGIPHLAKEWLASIASGLRPLAWCICDPGLCSCR
ncbi:hypothetical protein, partial [Corynebacterium sp.]|uniref:hypothetical protein n=1 Tax=Corynebacterium sp. TaxID=1720 RepID=UPI0026DC9DA8